MVPGPKICPPKLAGCCMITSIWGFVMLILVGIFTKGKSVALLEDMPIIGGGNGTDPKHYAFDEVALHCFVAAGLYFLFFVFSLWQKKVNDGRQYAGDLHQR
eukprot:scpid90418/ scgid15667/ Ribonuclease kappa; Ribonuclease kappa